MNCVQCLVSNKALGNGASFPQAGSARALFQELRVKLETRDQALRFLTDWGNGTHYSRRLITHYPGYITVFERIGRIAGCSYEMNSVSSVRMNCQTNDFEYPLPLLRQHFDHEGDGHEGAEGGAEIGEHHDKKNPGDLVPLESLEGSDVMVYAQIGRPHSLQIPINAKPRSAHLPGRRYRSSLVLPKWDSASRKDLRKARGSLNRQFKHLQG